MEDKGGLQVEEDVQTRYEIFQQLQEARTIACGKDVGYNTRAEAWRRIDFLLDTMIDLDGIAALD